MDAEPSRSPTEKMSLNLRFPSNFSMHFHELTPPQFIGSSLKNAFYPSAIEPVADKVYGRLIWRKTRFA